MRPVVNGLKQKYSNNVRFADLDYNDRTNRPLVEKYRVVGHPSFLLLDGQGNQTKRWVGIVTAADLESALSQVTSQ
ncbi:MAG: hypothetical protein JWP00_3600 [Chloroflexi bacterium]|jgi:thioredoxin-related protein|nr:hypothetical protein [Chloroflexota bacterium]